MEYLLNSGLINNCRTFYKYLISHHEKDYYLSMDADQELPDDQLPRGHTPIWIEPHIGATQVQMLERCEDIVGGRYKDVMVLYDNDKSPALLSWCGERGWQYHFAGYITGCEAQCVILLNCGLLPEYITRGINMLIIVSNDK